MRLCMFHPVGHPLERGWVGRVEDDRVFHLAAQTLQSFFTGGGTAREHAEYALADVVLLTPILHPPAIRIFDGPESFAFANPAAVLGPRTSVRTAPNDTVSQGRLALAPRLAAVIGAEGALAAFTILADWRDPSRRPPKDRDFALGLGPVVVTGDADRPEADGFDWAAAVELAATGTALYPGDILASPAGEPIAADPGGVVTVEIRGIGGLEQRLA